MGGVQSHDGEMLHRLRSRGEGRGVSIPKSGTAEGSNRNPLKRETGRAIIGRSQGAAHGGHRDASPRARELREKGKGVGKSMIKKGIRRRGETSIHNPVGEEKGNKMSAEERRVDDKQGAGHAGYASCALRLWESYNSYSLAQPQE